jgi:ubiquinone/menaquinone biosynthesis C-methylase UbiE
MARNFDTIAIFYDSLVKLVFGKTIRLAQTNMLQAVPPGSRVLIVGGGTGWILEELSIVHGTGLRITYIDSSAKMISLAKKRYAASNRVKFVAESIKTAQLKDTYNVIITPFFFDMFSAYNAQKVFEKLNRHVNEASLWLYTDFVCTPQNTFYQKTLLKVMYWFFRFTCGIEATKVPDMERFFLQNGYRLALEKKFLGNFITSRVYNPSYPD